MKLNTSRTPLDFLSSPGTYLAYSAGSAKVRQHAPGWINHLFNAVFQIL